MEASFRFVYTCVCIIIHPAENRILLLATEKGWSLPQQEWKTSQWLNWAEVARLNQDMQQQLNLKLTTLCCLGHQYNLKTNCDDRIYVMELHSSAWAVPTHAHWVSKEELMSLPLTMPEYRLWCTQWFANREETSRVSKQVPWYIPGWFAKVATWIEKQLAHLDAKVTAPPEQLRVGERGCLLRITTTGETFYFKALPPRFVHELSLLQHLTGQHPAQIPTLVAIENAQQWMLMQDFGDHLLSQSEVIEHWEQALQRYASLQIAQIGQKQQLIALKCPEMPLETLIEKINALVADTGTLMIEPPIGLSEQDVTRLRNSVPQIRALCHELLRYNIPETLEHGDLWGGNIALTNAGYVYFDWTDSCITHPFFSLYPFLLGIEARWATLPDARIRLRNAYLQQWTSYASMEQLVSAFELAQRLAPLYLASLYSTLIIPNMEAKWEMQHAVPYNLKILLERIHEESTT